MKKRPCFEKCGCEVVWPSKNPEFYASLVVREAQESNSEFPKGIQGLLQFLDNNLTNVFGGKIPDPKKFSVIFQGPELTEYCENLKPKAKV